MFNWFKKITSSIKATPKLDENSIQNGNSITQRAISESEALNNQGNIYLRNNKLQDAAKCFRQAIACNTDGAEAHYNLGITLKELGHINDAVQCHRRAVEIKPDYAEAHYKLGNALNELGQFNNAAECYRQALEINPEYTYAHINLGNVLHKRGKINEAIDCYLRALEIKPDFAEVHNNLGILLMECNRLTEAEISYRRALELKPDFADAHANLGNLLLQSKRLIEAKSSYSLALELNPIDPDAHTNLAITLLTLGDMKAGWEQNEWRWETLQMLPDRRNFAQPQWRGEAAEGRTLLIHAEQGFGDTLQFCRYVQLVAARRIRIILEVQKPLIRLLGNLPGVEQVIGTGETLPIFDIHCPMLSMPLALGTTLATIPCSIPYLQADENQINAWHVRLSALPNKGYRVGLVWAGNPRTNLLPHLAATDRRRSVTPELLAPLFNLPGFHFFSLQKDGTAAPESFPLTDFMHEMNDFADTAALIANLDLVISVDTAVVHLAGAMGKSVWMLDRFDSCWRWLDKRQDSPWYPSLRIFRQPSPGNWQAAVKKVIEELPKLANDRSNNRRYNTELH